MQTPTLQTAPPHPSCELTILMPCLNEAETLAVCIAKAQRFLQTQQLDGEVLIADNGSTDGSQQIAQAAGARVCAVPEKGYGSALLGGIRAARGRYVIMGDADDSYDFSALGAFLDTLRDGAQLVMGNRFQGGIKPGAMPALHRYLGNPVLSGIGRIFFGSPIGDFHCGLRGFEREALLNLDLHTTGMEFASEMVVKATLYNLDIREVPTTLSPDGRSRPPHLRSWRDGWRHLRFLLMYSPRWLFLYPGLCLIGLGLAGMLALLPGPLIIGTIGLDIHTLLLSGTAIILGIQAVTFSLLARQFAINVKLLPDDPKFISALERFSLEKLLVFGVVLMAGGLGGIAYSIYAWGQAAFGALDAGHMMRLLVPAVTLLAAGFQLIISSFFRNIIGLFQSTPRF